MQPKSGLIRGVASLEGENIMEIPYFLHKNAGLSRGVASGERGLIRGGPLYHNISRQIQHSFPKYFFFFFERFPSLASQSFHTPIIYSPSREATPLIRPHFWCIWGGLIRGGPLYRHVGT